MICTSCNRNLASTLSVCPSCGTMVFDSVREELASKISTITKTTISELKEKPVVSINQILPAPKIEMPVSVKQTPPPVELTQTIIENPAAMEIAEPVAMKRTQTAELIVKPTSPTLVGFNHKNATLPEWRLQMQNAVVKRRNGREIIEETVKPQVVAAAASRRAGNRAISGATALKVQTEERPIVAAIANAELSPLERAMLRIEASRQKHYVAEEQVKEQFPATSASVKYFPAASPSRSPEFFQKTEQSQTVAKFATKPNVASINELRTEKKFDTNKLPPLPARISSSFENRPVVHTSLADYEDEEFIRNTIDTAPEVTAYGETTAIAAQNEEEIDDCAPLGLRFNSALFDLLIGSFISLLLLSPFMLLSENFFSTQGFLAFLATSAIVMFVYLTTSIGFLGRTFGMKIFSLEIVDIDENAYPTIHQAAVSSSVYLVSLALGGLGFLTLLVNNEKRAAHDLLSGTIIVKEY